MKKVFFVSLGCDKNLVDSEEMLGALVESGWEITDDESQADGIVINTCCFIHDAKEESVNTILEMARYRQEGSCRALLVTGCLAQRYRQEITEEIPEVDAVLGTGSVGQIVQALDAALAGEKVLDFAPLEGIPTLPGKRVVTTGGHYEYLKIAEGCEKNCTYCIIPKIRGAYRSVPMERLLAQAEELAAQGVRELILVAQETTLYGKDLYGEKSLHILLEKLCRIPGIQWIRLLYCYPDCITDELIDTIASEQKIVKYLDLPLQHASGKILRAMNRRGDRESLTALLNKLRERVPGIVLRTTLITGFPGETEEDFTELAEFVRDIRFERLGCFAYSREEGTPAADLPDQVEEEVKRRRADIIMEQQMEIMQEYGESQIGKTVQVLTEGFDRYAECYFGRSYADAPDVDGKVFFHVPAGKRKPYFGKMVRVRIDDCMDCDLTGELI